MSLKDYLTRNQASMKEFLDTRDRIVAQKIFESYCIPVEDLLKCFKEQESLEETLKKRPTPIKVNLEEDKKEYTESCLLKCSPKELKKICKSKKLKKYSKLSKKDLVGLILGKKVCSPKEDKPKVVLRKHPYFKDYFVHTGFLIKTKKEGVVGKVKEREDDTPIIEPLDESDIAKCKTLRLPIKNFT
jgi:hypothetical protein